ncbi:hypothetical protein D3C72_2237440 [compost metagenome]
MVAKDDNDIPVQVPGLILENREQVRRFIEAKSRIDIRRQYRKELNDVNIPEKDEQCRLLLAGERCQIVENEFSSTS